MRDSNSKTRTVMERRVALRERLFRHTRNSGREVTYAVYPGMEDEAARTWAEHGVCPECSMLAISCGRCVQCGWEGDEQKERRAKQMAVHEARVARVEEFLKGGG